MRILVIKTSSLGDIIHTLPALSDAKKIYPDLRVDWVVEESFQEIPLWHHAVYRVIPIALRRWRKEPWNKRKVREMLSFLTALREEQYDYIIDAQGLLKSAVLMLFSRTKRRIGLSWKSAREPLASLFYQKQAKVLWGQHAVMRTRALFAQGLEYALPNTAVDYGIDHTRLPTFSLPSSPYYVFLHGTTWATKHWPEVYWIELAKRVTEAGYTVQLLWGNEEEKARAHRIAKSCKGVSVVSQKLRLSEVMTVLAEARGIVTVDTGLGHLAAALGIPTVSLYGPTDPNHSGTFGRNQTNLAARFVCAPCFSRVCTYQGKEAIQPACFGSLQPKRVLQHLNLTVREVVE